MEQFRIFFNISADTVEDVFGKISPPPQISPYSSGAEGISAFLSILLELFFAVTGLVFLSMVLWGSFQWITSGGEKEAIAKARGRITHAIIGILFVGLSMLIVQIIGQILGFSIFKMP